MTDLTENFPTLVDSVTGEGQSLVARQEGEAAAGIEGAIGFAFKDSSGNVVLPALTADGKIPVTLEGSGGLCLDAQGQNTAGSLTEVVIATIAGSLSKTYSDIEAIGSCLQATRFRVVYVDDANGTPVETELYSFLVGAGQYSFNARLKCKIFNTNSGTGDQEIRILAQNIKKASCIDATIALLEK